MNQLNVLFLIPRYKTYGMTGHYVMPMGILYVSAYTKRSVVCRVYTLNLNHVEGDEYEILQDFCLQNEITILGVGGLSGEYEDLARMVCFARKIKPEMFIIV